MPSYTDKLLTQALHHQSAGRFQDAETFFRKALSLEPNRLDSLLHLSHFLALTGRAPESLDLLQRAQTLRPNDPDIPLRLSEAARLAARLDEAVAYARRAVSLSPQLPEAHNNLGALLMMLSQEAEAEAEFALVLRLHPDHPETLLNLGNLRSSQGLLDQAIAFYQRLLAIAPRHVGAWSNLAAVYQEFGSAAESLAAYKRAVTLAPSDPVLRSNYLLALNRASDQSPADVLTAHRAYDRDFVQPHLSLRRPHTNDRSPNRRLKIGYVSFDFRNHPVGRFIEPLLTHHDHTAFHITCYSSVMAPDAVTDRLRQASDAWRDVPTLSDFALAELIRSDAIDLLVDLSGHTNGNRLQAFGLQPAPIQLTYLGYPNTTGLSTIAFRLTDPLADPPGLTDQWHTESLLRLPTTAWCYTPPSDSPPIPPSSFLLHPTSPITFASFNTFSKVTDQTISLWSRVLSTLPQSRLLLKANSLASPATRQHTLNRFATHGVSADRLEFLPWESTLTAHLAAYQRADIALDTFPYHGTTTTCEALFMGLPVITLAGPIHASRVGVSLLTNVGFPNLIAQTPDQFVSIAATLATNLPRLSHLRATLRDRLAASPLTNAPTFTHDIESAYRTIWQQYCASSSRDTNI